MVPCQDRDAIGAVIAARYKALPRIIQALSAVMSWSDGLPYGPCTPWDHESAAKLCNLLRDEDEYTRWSAYFALKKVDPRAELSE
jgi:hypothetical protein